MSTRHNQNKFLLRLVIGMIFLSTIFANCLTARAEDSSQIIIKESSEHTIKPVVRPSRKNINTKYKVKVGPVKIITPQNQNQGLDKSNRTHGISSLSAEDSKFKTEIKIIPIKKISPVTSEGLKITDGNRSRRQRPLPEGAEKFGNIKINPISKPEPAGRTEHRIKSGEDTNLKESEQTDNIKGIVSVPMPIDRPEKGNKRFEVPTGTIKAIESENAQKSQSLFGEEIKVTRIRAWKLDESGRKTNEKIRDDTTVIEGVYQPPAELNK